VSTPQQLSPSDDLLLLRVSENKAITTNTLKQKSMYFNRDRITFNFFLLFLAFKIAFSSVIDVVVSFDLSMCAAFVSGFLEVA